jgi:hypothetical protein
LLEGIAGLVVAGWAFGSLDDLILGGRRLLHVSIQSAVSVRVTYIFFGLLSCGIDVNNLGFVASGLVVHNIHAFRINILFFSLCFRLLADFDVALVVLFGLAIDTSPANKEYVLLRRRVHKDSLFLDEAKHAGVVGVVVLTRQPYDGDLERELRFVLDGAQE